MLQTFITWALNETNGKSGNVWHMQKNGLIFKNRANVIIWKEFRDCEI